MQTPTFIRIFEVNNNSCKMKKNIFLIISLFLYLQVDASHLFGGEITWQCLKSGQDQGKYIFTVKVYRDCNGIPFTPPSSITIYSSDSDSTHFPSIWSIPLNPAMVFDISPSFCPSNCVTGGPGTVQEFVQTSPPTSLSGIPPVTGWIFEIDDCCRNSLINLSSGGQGFTIRSVMFPFNNQNTNPCFDSSPYFVERPELYTCTGYPHTYNPFASDNEMDSLSYSWGECIEQPSTLPPAPFAAMTIPYSLPYSINNPIPGNPILNALSGVITMDPGLAGNFTFCIKVESFKCGIKIAEIYRDMGFTLTNNCTLSNTSNVNTPPEIAAPFIDPNSGLYTSYADTVFAGDTVNFNFSAYDFEIGTSNGPNDNNPQLVTLNSVGSQYGTGYTNPNSGCLIPPCATLSVPTPITSLSGLFTSFNWVTTPSHLGLQYGCVYLPNTYYFLLKANDNYCPAYAADYGTVSITVLPTVPAPIVNNNGGTLSTPFIPGFSYQWYLNRFLIPGATSNSFTPVTSGFYQVRIMDANLNGNYSAGYNINTGYDDPASAYNLLIHPNPASGTITLQLNSDPADHVAYCLRDLTGRVLLSEQIQKHSTVVQKKINLSSYRNGIYLLELNVNNNLINKKIIVNN